MDEVNEVEHKPYTATSLAKEAGIDFSYVARLCRQEKIPAFKLGNTWIISFEDGQAWLTDREAKQKPKAH